MNNQRFVDSQTKRDALRTPLEAAIAVLDTIDGLSAAAAAERQDLEDDLAGHMNVAQRLAFATRGPQ